MQLSERIGVDASARIEGFRQVVSGLREAGYPEIDRALQAALESSGAATTRVSVVGQVKAGKSSLINALTGLRDFLPTEVNPWTAVITNLHFGGGDAGASGGVFRMFDEGEWRRMIEGNAETRKLAEELLPGFDSDVLRQQVEKMQADAKRRLGNMYHHLLGKEHRFNTVTREVLDRYVSAGFAEGVRPESAAGKFSGITKSAEIFLPAGPFAVPVTLSDTPGINDPFLVRDEITTSSFREADIFVVALSVHQPLNTADIGLLKLLSHHSGKRTVVFVNRIDELADPAAALPDLVRLLDERLKRELPTAAYSIIAGSASLGALAQFGSDEEVAAAVGRPEMQKLWRQIGDGEADDRQKLRRLSGVQRLSETLSTLIADGPVRFALGKAAAEVETALDLLSKTLEERARQDAALADDSGGPDGALAAERARIAERREVLRGVSAQLRRRADRARERLLDNADSVTSTIEKTIDLAVANFADGQVAALRESLKSASTTRWGIETAAIRATIEERVCEAFAAGRDGLDALLAEHAERFQEAVAPIAGKLPLGQLAGNLPHDEILPGFKAASILIDVELRADRGWRFWKSASMTEDEAADCIRKVIRAELYPAIADLKKSTALAIAERTGAAIERLETLLLAAESMVEDEIATIDRDVQALDGLAGEELLDRLTRGKGERRAVARRRLAELASARAQIATGFADERIAASGATARQ